MLSFCKVVILSVALYLVFMFPGSCADIMHSAQPFRNGFKENVIGVILRDVIQGLEYLHSLGYVHRLDQNPLQKGIGLHSLLT